MQILNPNQNQDNQENQEESEDEYSVDSDYREKNRRKDAA